MKTEKVLNYFFNILNFALIIIALHYLANLSTTCDVIIETEYPLCNEFYNQTIKDADFFTIKYIREMYGKEFYSKWHIENCKMKLPKIESLPFNYSRPNFEHYDINYSITPRR